MPITKNISEIKPTISSFNIKITHPIQNQINCFIKVEESNAISKLVYFKVIKLMVIRIKIGNNIHQRTTSLSGIRINLFMKLL